MQNKIPQDEINGCGGKGSRFRPPYHLFFKASCDKHDEGYFIGGTSLDRWYADQRFYLAMRYDVKRKIKNYFLRQYYLIWCKIYYFAVRCFGAKHFSFRKK